MPPLRTLARAFVALFTISTAFPIVAGLLRADQVPTVLGLADVAIAAVTVVVGLTLESRARSANLVGEPERAASFRIIQRGSVALLGLLALFLVGVALPQWSVLLAGLAWRAWLLIWVLPAVVAGLRTPEPSHG